MPSMKAFPGCVINNLHATAGAVRLLLVVGWRMAARLTAARLTSSDFFVVHGRNADCKNKVMQPRFEYKCGFLNCDVALILQSRPRWRLEVADGEPAEAKQTADRVEWLWRPAEAEAEVSGGVQIVWVRRKYYTAAVPKSLQLSADRVCEGEVGVSSSCVTNNLHATAGAVRLLLVVGRRMAARFTSSDFFVVHGRVSKVRCCPNFAKILNFQNRFIDMA
nr:hypothetical protein Iba_chr15bCG8410 [Ipomoea batatas]